LQRRRGQGDLVDFAIKVPRVFGFTKHDVVNPDLVLSIFDWTPQLSNVEIDLSECVTANYQAVSLLVLYAWHLKSRGCKVLFKRGPRGVGATQIYDQIGASGWHSVLHNQNIGFQAASSKPLFAIRNQRDFSAATNEVDSYTKPFNVEYEKTLRYVISELLYNTLEHGHSSFSCDDRQIRFSIRRQDSSSWLRSDACRSPRGPPSRPSTTGEQKANMIACH
jgi:hypothetical protein